MPESHIAAAAAAAPSPRHAGRWLHSAFYRFAPLADPDAVAEALRRCAGALTGSVLVAPEGISGAVAGEPAAVAAFEAALQHDAAFGAVFAGIVFKRSGGVSAPFARLAIVRKPELVAFGVPGVSGLAAPAAVAAPTALDPQAWRALLDRDDVVLIDNRNSFEFRLGRFRGAIDPQVRNFREFADWVTAHADEWRAADRTLAMYCTGGIRCEKTDAWMQGLGLKVAQLDGGILNYLQAMPDAERDWQGECFVFDNRIALDHRLHETATTAAQVYDPARPDEAWRLERALRLDASAAEPGPP